MAINAGTVQAELGLNAKKYNQNMEKATRVMVNFGNMVKEKSKEMQSSLDALDKKQKLWNMTMDKVTKALRGNAKEYDTLKQKINIVTKEIDGHEKKLEEVRKEYGTSSKQAKEYEDALLDLKIQQAELNQEMEKFTLAGKLKAAGTQMQEFGRNWTMKVTAPIAALGTAVTGVAMNFDAKMSEVQAISGATGEQFKLLEGKAKEMGRTTKFSASESAEALKYMAMAGWETEDMLAGIDGVMMLAASSGEDLALVSDIVTDALSAFGMEAGQATQFADLLAKTATSSNTNVGLMGETFKYVAPIFGALGYNAEDAALAIGLMANAGIKGSQAGTVLRGAITRLVKPSKDAAGLIDELGLSLTDAHGQMLPFSDVMVQMREKFAGLSEEQQAQYAATIFGQEAMSGMLTIINASEEDFNKLTDATRNYNGAAGEMSDIMQDNLKGRLTELKSKLEGVALQLSETLIPVVEKFVDKISSIVDWSSNLNPTTQEAIVKFAGLAAVMGPAAVIGGKVASGMGSMIGLFKTLTPAIKTAQAATTAAGTAAEVAGSGFSLAGLAAKAGALLLNPWTVGIAAAGIGAIALAKHLKKDSIPAVDLFGEEVSENTQKAVGGFLDLEEQATKSLNQLSWSGQEVTTEMAESITGNFDEMKNQVVSKLEEQKTDALKSLDEMFSKSKGMTDEEKEEILRITGEKYDNQIKTTEEGSKKIEEILKRAADENRELTTVEVNFINAEKKRMKETGIRILSESEKEQLAIMERLKQESGKISAKQAADIVKNSKEQKEKTIAEAEEEYNERLKYAAELRADGTAEAIAMADKIAEEAKRQRDEAVEKAEDMHLRVVEEAKTQAEEHVNQVDWETGEIKSKWQAMKDDVLDKAKEIRENVIERWEEIKTATSEKWENIKTDVADSWKDMKKETFEKVQDIWLEMTTKWEAIKRSTEKNWDRVKSKVEDSIKTVKDKIDGGIDRIKEWNRTKVQEKIFSVVEKIKRVFSGGGFTSGGGGGGGDGGGAGSNARGTDYWRGGLTWVGEEGAELIELPRGTKIHDHGKSLRMAQAAAASLNIDMFNTTAGRSGQTAAPVASPAKGGDIHQHITINSPTPLTPSEIARKNLQVSRQLAMEWGL